MITKLRQWQVTGKAILGETDLSAIARVTEEKGLLASDETQSVQYLNITAGSIEVGDDIRLWSSSGDEVDIESIATEANTYYIVGSHGVTRKKARVQPSRYNIFRLTVDPSTGKQAAGSSVETASVRDLIKNDSLLGPYAEKRLHYKGVNIEGAAVRDGRLYLGFRGPTFDEGDVPVLSLNATGLFEGSTSGYDVKRVALGQCVGIRDLVALDDGFLILSGNSGVKKHKDWESICPLDKPFRLQFWDGDSTLKTLGTFEDIPGKAEAILLLDESPSSYTILAIFDGPAHGSPTEYRVEK